MKSFLTRLYAHCFFDELMLIYPFYAVMFVDHGLTPRQIATLLAVWCATHDRARSPLRCSCRSTLSKSHHGYRIGLSSQWLSMLGVLPGILGISHRFRSMGDLGFTRVRRLRGAGV